MTKEVHHHHHHYGTRRRRRPYWRTRHHHHRTSIHKETKISADDLVGLIALCVFVLIALATCA